MIDRTLDISIFERAVSKLGEILERYGLNKNDEAIRDAVIQRFEFTYSLALTTLKKYFAELAFITEDVSQMSFNDMIRTANQQNLLVSDLEKWSDYRKMRNMTSHTYDENIAKKVVEIIPDFYNEMLFLFNRLKEAVKK